MKSFIQINIGQLINDDYQQRNRRAILRRFLYCRSHSFINRANCGTHFTLIESGKNCYKKAHSLKAYFYGSGFTSMNKTKTDTNYAPHFALFGVQLMFGTFPVVGKIALRSFPISASSLFASAARRWLSLSCKRFPAECGLRGAKIIF